MADHCRSERHQPSNHAARVHHVGDKDEHRHGDQEIAVVEAVHCLIDDKADVLMGCYQIDEAGGQHRQAERCAEHRSERKDTEQNPKPL